MQFNCVHFLQNKTILVTGATGFLAKVFVEKILRVQPNVNKLYLVVRASDNEAAKKRLRTEAFEKDLFKVLRENLGDEKLNTLLSEKVVPVAGDIAMDHLGMKDSKLRECIQQEIDIVVNVAATTNFDERYDVSLGINTFGALNVLNFAKKCVKAQLLLHVSTAYVCGEKPGLLPEKPFIMEEIRNENGLQLDINLERKLMKQRLKELNEQDCSEEDITLSMKKFGMERAKLHGWPNTYVFTKSMGEMLLGNHKENLPLVIIRPTMITSTLSEPFPGWIEGLRTVDSVIIAYGKGVLKCFLVDVNSVCDMIPADMVANAMITAAATHAGGSNVHMVYQVGSSNQNPITYGEIREILFCFFTKNSLRSRNGSLITVTKMKLIPTMALFSLYMTLRYKLPLQLLKLVDIIKYKNKNRKIDSVMRLVKLYEPYVLFKGIFDDRNTKNLCTNKKEEESKNSETLMFDFDPKVINWRNYLINVHIPGLITHVLKK
ncbi:Fatty acyl-CoA reductase C-terminal [Arabidopsis thaliana x Arabidopsis arenosa]|uniref:Fatty acyl-CoA reductase n=1 Tax=Arabidopsis thaliana x Arabidopsis arenosa TaxID=1240361 RepID=A0A8T1ZM98_9BRAS|nr:Fatty acyl-CoA reductase C-terminal [Arabidopsis thaliana x Arabidopsis arenosa]